MNPKNLAINAVLLLISLGVALGTAELVLRYADKKEAAAQKQKAAAGQGKKASAAQAKDAPAADERWIFEPDPDPDIVFRLAPLVKKVHKTDEFEVSVKINSEGLRDVEHAKEKGPGRTVVLGIGDSFTFGFGADYEDTYLRQLEKRLNGGGTRHYEVVKAGIWAHDTISEAAMLNGLVKRYQPDIVVLGFVDNDLTDIAWGGVSRYHIKGGWLGRRDADKRMWLYRNSALFKFSIDKWRVLSSRLMRVGRPAFAHGDGWTKDFVDIYKTEEPEYVSEAWGKAFAAIKSMKGQADKAGAKLLVVGIPNRDRYFQGTAEGYDFGLVSKKMDAFCRENGILFYDAGLAIKAGGGRGMYFKNDPHLNPEGYKALGGGIYEYMLENGLAVN